MSDCATQACEDILRSQKDYNIEHNILRSETAIVDRLLTRSTELRDTYQELHDKLGAEPTCLEVFFIVLLGTAAFWSPDRLREAREQRRRLEDLNRRISTISGELATLLEQRRELENTSSFGSNAHCHCIDVIIEASKDNHLFNSWVKDEMESIKSQFDLKYWPNLEDIVREISCDASKAKVYPIDPITIASMARMRTSRADFPRALLTALDESSSSNGGQLPRDFKLSDDTLASLMNCALDLEPEAIVDGPYIKRLRQRDRAR